MWKVGAIHNSKGHRESGVGFFFSSATSASVLRQEENKIILHKQKSTHAVLNIATKHVSDLSIKVASCSQHQRFQRE